MGSLYRSEEMTLCQLFLQSESAYTCVSELGELGLVQFRDLNPDVNAFQRKFVNEVRRCYEMERKLRFLEKEIKKDSIPMLDTGDKPDAPLPREMIDLEATFEKLENEMKEVNANSEALKRNYLELTELKHILRRTQGFFEEAELLRFDDQNAAAIATGTGGAANLLDIEQNVSLLNEDNMTVLNTQLGFVAGVILRERIPAFERMLWRACRGNVFLKQAEIDTPLEDPVTGDQVNKSVFIIFFQGDQLKSKVKKICEGFRATLYPCPETPTERREMAIGVMTRIEDLNTVLGQTQDHRHRVLVAAAKNLKVWFIKVKKIKAIYHILNMFNLDVTQKCLIAECWCAIDDLDKIQLALRRGTERSGSSVPSILNRMQTHQDPPTYHRTNKFTECFQSIVDSYGVATYREVNAAPFAVITFPFLFSLMFGDAGHGFIMLLFGIFMVVREKQLIAAKSDNEIWNTFFGGRYIIVLMGMFSIYSGFLYNDVFSKSLKIFSSGWHAPPLEYIKTNASMQLDPLNMTSTYPFGMDPVWQLASNKITFLNSFKMKISIIFGVIHMTFGVVLSLSNHRYYKQAINIYCEFVPQIIFMLSIFGYLALLIFIKWFKFGAQNSQEAPNLLIGFINMFMLKSDDLALYSGQKGLQTFLLLIAVICVPWMLAVKPYLLWKANKNRTSRGSSVTTDRTPIVTPPMTDSTDPHSTDDEIIHYDNNEQPVNPASAAMQPPPNQEFELGEVVINQCIHTIEYCLGCISHTASYLRLWALSLAHAELSEVLWSMVFQKGLKIEGYWGALGVFVAFTPWAVLTVAVLLLMEGLSAFLHTLRLHWVEFMSKFYKGQGYIFQPFSFEQIIEQADE